MNERRKYTPGQAAQDALTAFMRGFTFSEGIADRERQRERQAENDRWTREQRGQQRKVWDRTQQQWDYEDATRETPEQVQERRTEEGRGRRLLNDARQLSLDSAPSPEEARAARGRKAQLDDLNIEGAREANRGAREGNDRAAANHSEKQQRQRVLAGRRLLQSPIGESLRQPESRAAWIDMGGRMLRGERLAAGVTSEQVLDYANQMFSRELQRGVGDAAPNGGKITGKRIVAAYMDGDSYVLELDVEAVDAKGNPYNYRAPVTKGRTSEDTDEVLRLPRRVIEDRVQAMAALAHDIEAAGGYDEALARTEAMYLESGGKPADLDPTARGKISAKSQYLNEVAQLVGGDMQRALAIVESGDLTTTAANIAAKLKEDRREKRTYDVVLQDVLGMLTRARDEQYGIRQRGGAGNGGPVRGEQQARPQQQRGTSGAQQQQPARHTLPPESPGALYRAPDGSEHGFPAGQPPPDGYEYLGEIPPGTPLVQADDGWTIAL